MTGYELQYISTTDGAFDCTLAANATSTSVIEQKFLSTSYALYSIYFGVNFADVKLNDYAGDRTLFWYPAGAITTSSYWTLNEEHTVSVSASEYKWNGVKIYDTTEIPAIPSTPRFRTAVQGHINYFKITDNNVDIVNLVAWQDGNGNLGLYDKVNDVFYTPSSGTWTAGPRAHIFTIDKSNARFAASGGTETVEIEAETTWTASTPSFVSVSPSTGDTGTTQVTISCPSYSGETRREDVITFTDNDDYTLTFKARQNGNSAGFSNIYLGDNNLLSNTIYLGDNAVNTIYLGEEIIYSNGPFVGLKVKPLELLFNNASLTNEITIQSSEDWTITDDSGGWLSYSTTTGTTGKTVVTVTASTTQADRTATITITTANYSATVSVSQQLIQFLDYIYVDQARDRYCFIDTGIYPTTDTVATIKYKDMGIDNVCLYGFSVAGYYGDDTPQVAPNDNSDYRFVSGKNYVGTIFDLNSSRFTYSNLSVDADGYANVTIGNYYVYDNVAQTSRGTGTTQSSIVTTTIPMYINISNIIRFNSAQIMQGNNLVFDGHAAYYNGVYGVYDNVSGQMLLPYIPTYPVVGGNY